VAKGVGEEEATRIFDDMMDFAKYAFNKSHAACYAVVAYQTAWLKYYYPVEFMAALMTSVIDNPGKVAEYIMTCRNMGIAILPPDVNEGEGGFSVSNRSIRYALTAIRSVGHPVITGLVEERNARGPFIDLKDFIARMSERDLNKKAIENFIKAGALDGLSGSRKQFMSVYVQLADSITRERKNNLTGQMSLFDIADEGQKADFEVKLPAVGEYSKEMQLAFEKEVLGVYVSGHPLEAYEEMWRSCITNTTADFYLSEENEGRAIGDNQMAVIGGIIADKKIKYTRNDKIMAFLQVEDLVGTVEVIVFPRDYERNSAQLSEDNKIFVKGRVSLEEEKDGKLICERIVAFDAVPRKLWVKFPDKDTYEQESGALFDLLAPSDGNDSVIIYIADIKALKRLPPNRNVCADEVLTEALSDRFGKENIKVVWDFKKD
jgi:DNA polymerase-3 subunit alpha